MNCKACRESLVPYLEKVPGAPSADVERHLAECEPCRSEAAAVRVLRDRMVRLGEAASAAPSIEQPVMDRIAKHVQETQEGKPMMTTRKRFFAHPWRLSAASLLFAAIIGAALIFVGRGDRYAFAQTVEAHRSVRCVHIQLEPGAQLKLGMLGGFSYPSETDEREFWIEVGEDGKPVRVRSDMAWTLDGPKTIFLHDGKCDIWFHSKNLFLTVNDKSGINQFPKEFVDPNSIVTALDQRVAAGKAKTTQIKSIFGTEYEPKVLVVNPPDSDGTVEVYVIDAKTKLLQEMEKYKKEGKEIVLLARYRFTQYNEPIPESVFTPALPANVTRIDQSTREVGLAQEKMTEAEISEKVARQFFESVIARDYGKAGVIYNGFPADEVKKSCERTFNEKPVVKIISIGPAKPDDLPELKRLVVFCVPCEVELGDGGRWTGTAYVRPVEGQPGRWRLDGFERKR